jgi:hypothetical protein
MKKFNLISVFLFTFLTMVSCGKGSDGKDASQQREEEKSIFGKWTSLDRTFTFETLDGIFDTPVNVTFRESSGEICVCRTVYSGGEESGTINQLSCFYAGGGPGDPGCANDAGDLGFYTYTKAGGALEVCDSRVRCQAFF